MEKEKHSWTKIEFFGKNVGYLRDDKLVFRTIRTENHYFRKYNGFGFSIKLLNHLDTTGVIKIVVQYKNERWETSISNLKDKGKVYMNYNDVQLILPKRYWLIRNEDGEIIQIPQFNEEFIR